MPRPKQSRPTPRQWPEAGELFAKLIRRAVPSLTETQCHGLALLLLDTPETPINRDDWGGNPTRDARTVLMDEATLVAMLVQGWTDRVGWAVERVRDDDALRNHETALRVIRSATRHWFRTLP